MSTEQRKVELLEKQPEVIIASGLDHVIIL